MRHPLLACAAAVLAAACRQPPAPPPVAPGDGADVVRAMHARHAPDWYRTLTFVQRTTFPGRPDQTWYESAAVPGRLRIDIAPVDSQNTLLFRSDSVYRVQRGRVVVARPLVHSLMLLLMDVNAQPPDTTIGVLRRLGFDLGVMAAGAWRGRGVWIVGAAAGDSTSPQFWIDRERLYLVRLIERGPDGSRSDWQVGGHTRTGRTWHETALEHYRNGVLTQGEVYADVRLDPELDPAIFEPGARVRPAWIP